MVGKFIDLHLHSTASDGSDRPKTLIAQSKQKGLIAVSVTDHDTVQGLAEAELAAKEAKISLIRGVEMAAASGEGELHLLGYFLPRKQGSIQALIEEAQLSRIDRNKKIIAALQQQGVSVTLDEVTRISGPESIGKPHIALILKKKKYVRSIQEAFEKYIGKYGSANVLRKLPSAQKVIKALVSEGVTVSYAHPCLNPHMTKALLDNRLEEFKGYGLSAIEAYHSGHSAEATRMCVDAAKKHNLLLTGGSDYHGTIKSHITIGSCGNKGKIPFSILEKLREARKKQGLWTDLDNF